MVHRNATPPPPESPDASGQARLTPPDNMACGDEAMFCEGCGNAAMYRVHAVWRCPECGSKTDWFGW